MNAKRGASDGALRAATAAAHEIMNTKEWHLWERDRLAEIIDRETGLPELVEALQMILLDLDSGFIAQESVSAERARKAHEDRIRTVLAGAKRG